MSRTTCKDEIRLGVFREVYSKEYREMFRRIQEDSASIDGFTDVDAFISFMQGSDEESWELKNNALFDLIVAARFSRTHGPAAQTLLIAVLWPGLDRISKQVEPAPEEIQDSFAEVYLAALQKIHSWNLNKREKIAINILLDVKKQVMKLYESIRNRATVPFAAPDNTEDDVDSGQFQGGAREIEDEKTTEMVVEENNCASVLDRLVAANVLSPQESLLIALHIFHDRDLVEIAESGGVNYKTLCRQYERAIQRLKTFFDDEKRFLTYLDGGENP